jgi:ferrous iron transport protein A
MPALSEAALHTPCRVIRVAAPAATPEWQQWLEELGFLPGETAIRLASAPGGDPLVVRIGDSTFALRTREAACIEVETL